MSCNQTFYGEICQCIPYNSLIIILTTGLTVGTVYDVVVTDKFSNKYKAIGTVNAQGNVEFHSTDLPDGLFNQYAGVFHVELFQPNTCNLVLIPVKSKYESITLEIVGGNLNQNTIGCP